MSGARPQGLSRVLKLAELQTLPVKGWQAGNVSSSTATATATTTITTTNSKNNQYYFDDNRGNGDNGKIIMR